MKKPNYVDGIHALLQPDIRSVLKHLQAMQLIITMIKSFL